MSFEKDYIEKNKQLWNKKTDFHIDSEFYDMENFLKGKSSLNETELKLLGNITGKSVLHLQCHFGQDTISLSRMGAKATGVDLSDHAIERAKVIAQSLAFDTEFICCNIYDLPNHLNKQFDVVFTSYGTIGWLPDLDEWAKIVSMFLKPSGKFIMADFHPVVWMFDNNFEKIIYSYFKSEPIVELESGTYADITAEVNLESVTWNHSTSEVINNLIKNGLVINSFDEFDYSPYNCFNQAKETETGKFQIPIFDNKIPMVFAIVATKGNS